MVTGQVAKTTVIIASETTKETNYTTNAVRLLSDIRMYSELGRSMVGLSRPGGIRMISLDLYYEIGIASVGIQSRKGFIDFFGKLIGAYAVFLFTIRRSKKDKQNTRDHNPDNGTSGQEHQHEKSGDA